MPHHLMCGCMAQYGSTQIPGTERGRQAGSKGVGVPWLKEAPGRGLTAFCAMV